jgi:hypothetical protein
MGGKSGVPLAWPYENNRNSHAPCQQQMKFLAHSRDRDVQAGEYDPDEFREVIAILKRAAIGDVVVGLEGRRERLHDWRADRCAAWACLSYKRLWSEFGLDSPVASS